MTKTAMTKRVWLEALLILALLTGVAPASAQNDSLIWWLTGSTLKVLPTQAAPADPAQPLHLHAAHQEYAPFQIVFRAEGDGATVPALTVDYPTEYFDLTLYLERFLELRYPPEEAEIFSFSRLTTAEALPDGLRPLDGAFDVAEDGVSVVWADLYVQPGTPPDEYTLTVRAGDETRQVVVTVYPVDLLPTPSMNVILPLNLDWTIPFYGEDDPDAFQRELNALLEAHYVTPGHWVAEPQPTDDGWDFSALDAEVAALPPGAFHAPLPFNDRSGYLLLDENGEPYTTTDFDDPVFVAQVEAYFRALADYLEAQGRLDDALVYPDDETRWVGDEPMHAGPAGYARLANWTRAARAAGFRITASGVAPVPPGPPDLGWLETSEVADDTHVHLDLFDGAPGLFADWIAQPGHSASVYLNEYGDLIDMPAAIHRGLLWHVYARGVRNVTGYAALEWVDRRYNLIDPWTEPERLVPVSGYGGGALVWPGPLPSIRLKMLREGIEDARLLDLYADTTRLEQAQAFAACLAPGALADQNPSPTLWDDAHAALLVALSQDAPVEEEALCLPPTEYEESSVLFDFDRAGDDLDQWEFDGAAGERVPSPWEDSGDAFYIEFTGDLPVAGFWFGELDWSGWTALQLDVHSNSDYITGFDVGLVDDPGSYVLLRGGALVVGPGESRTLTLPLVEPPDEEDEFDWSRVTYLVLEVNTATTQRDAFGNVATYSLGLRALTFDNFRLVR